MVEKIIKHVYPDNLDKMIINGLIDEGSIDLSKIPDPSGQTMFGDRLEELVILAYVTSETVTDTSPYGSHKVYRPTQKFLDELAFNKTQAAAEEQAARENDPK